MAISKKYLETKTVEVPKGNQLLNITDADVDIIIAGLHLYKELMAQEARAAVEHYEPSLASDQYMATCRLLAEIGAQTSHKL